MHEYAVYFHFAWWQEGVKFIFVMQHPRERSWVCGWVHATIAVYTSSNAIDLQCRPFDAGGMRKDTHGSIMSFANAHHARLKVSLAYIGTIPKLNGSTGVADSFAADAHAHLVQYLNNTATDLHSERRLLFHVASGSLKIKVSK